MKLRHPLLLRCAGWLVALLVRALLATVRYRLDPVSAAGHPADPRQRRLIYAFWHESLLFPIGFKVPATVLISLHADGELIAQACRHLGVGVVRGSSTRGGGQALVALAHQRDTHLVLMPDGPRGPRRRVQSGIIVLAAKTGLPIVPVGVGYTWAWRARSWDRLALPLPFSRMTAFAGRPLHVPAELNRTAIEAYRFQLEGEFLAMTADAERWADELAGQLPGKPQFARHRRPTWTEQRSEESSRS